MKIVYLHQYFRTPESGGGTRSFEFAKDWVERGNDVHVITSRNKDGAITFETIDGIKVHYLPTDYKNSFGPMKRIKVFFEFAILSSIKASRLRADIIFATSTPLTICVPALYCKIFKGTNYVFEVRDLWPEVPIAMQILRSKILIGAAHLLESIAYRFASHIITISPSMRDSIIKKGISENKVSCITQGCDNSIFQNLQLEENSWLPENLSNSKIVVYAGAVSTANNLKYVADLAINSKNIADNIRFVVLGGGAQLDELMKYASENGVLNDYIYFLGHVSKYEVAKWMHLATFTLATFTGPRELWIHGAQNKFFDSISAGKPIATNYLGWQTHFSIAEGIGIYIDQFDTSLALSQIAQAINDHEWMANVEGNCRRLANNSLNRKYLAGRCLEIVNAAAKVV
jgi:glycosyltransferase involved in cell wall biosynthesis